MSAAPGRGALLRRWAWRGAVVLAIAAPVVVQVAWQAHAELDAAAQARELGDEQAEVIHLGRALRWRLPGSGHDERAIDRLLAIAEAAEHDPEDLGHARALVAYREIRSALLGTRALDVPHAEVLAAVDGHIARLMTAQSQALGVPAADQARQLERLRVASEMPRAKVVLAAAALTAWVAATLWFVSRGIDGERGRLIRPTGTRAGLLALASLVLWWLAWRYA
jgi:hypothetical protein